MYARYMALLYQIHISKYTILLYAIWAATGQKRASKNIAHCGKNGEWIRADNRMICDDITTGSD